MTGRLHVGSANGQPGCHWQCQSQSMNASECVRVTYSASAQQGVGFPPPHPTPTPTPMVPCTPLRALNALDHRFEGLNYRCWQHACTQSDDSAAGALPCCKPSGAYNAIHARSAMVYTHRSTVPMPVLLVALLLHTAYAAPPHSFYHTAALLLVAHLHHVPCTQFQGGWVPRGLQQPCLHTRPLPQPTASSLVVEFFSGWVGGWVGGRVLLLPFMALRLRALHNHVV
jgi:hypothetical protein